MDIRNDYIHLIKRAVLESFLNTNEFLTKIKNT